jgi:1,2-dihydroxy-3-keto-5-methylthiopentene dioxygenase
MPGSLDAKNKRRTPLAKLQYKGETITDSSKIEKVMTDHGMSYEYWGVKGSIAKDEDVLTAYSSEINRLKQARGYVTADLVALSQATPNLETICAKFDKEHHHTADEVRFVVEGEGVFELEDSEASEFIKFTSEPGDLIVIPANRRHLFYLTEKKKIRCIRLFRDSNGWEAIYPKPGA